MSVHPGFKILQKLASGFVVSAVLVVASGGAHAGVTLAASEHPQAPRDCISPLAKKSAAAAVSEINAQTARLRHTGASNFEVDTYLASTYCLENIGQPQTAIELASARSDMYLASSLYYDSQAKLYYSISNWHWLNDAYFYEVPVINRCTGCRSAIGGEDGIGTAYSQAMTILSSSLSYWHAACSGIVATTAPAAANQYGVAYKAQDYWDLACNPQPISYLVDNTMFGGQEVISVKPTWTGCRSVQPFATYEHTWASTGITGISLSNSGVSISVSSTSNAWDRSAIGASANVCG